jgi:hypothetical protein
MTDIRTVSASGAVLAITQEVELKAAIVGAEKYPDLLDLDKRLSETQARMVLLEETPGAGRPAAAAASGDPASAKTTTKK